MLAWVSVVGHRSPDVHVEGLGQHSAARRRPRGEQRERVQPGPLALDRERGKRTRSAWATRSGSRTRYVTVAILFGLAVF